MKKSISEKELLAIIKKKGWKHKSGGAYSSVYFNTKHPKLVMKISRDPTDGWLMWANVTSGKKNPWFPQIHSCAVFDQPNDTGGRNYIHYIAIVEKLHSISSHKIYSEYDLLTSILNTGYDYWDTSKLRLNIPNWLSAPLVRCLALMKRVSRQCYVDMHDENVMRRGSQLVINDPFSGLRNSRRKYKGKSYKLAVINKYLGLDLH